MTLAADSDYPFLEVFWTMMIFVFWIIWIWLLIAIFGDLFRRHDLSGWAKTLWVIFVIVLPYLGVFIYVVTQGRSMAERNAKEVKDSKQQFDEYVQNVAGAAGPAAEIEKAHKLLVTGAITQAEFEAIKQKALA